MPDGIKQARQHNRHITAITSVYPDSPDLPPDLREVVRSWPDLPEPVKSAVLALVKHSVKAGRKGGRP